MKKNAEVVMRNLERALSALRFELPLADLDDEQYRRWLADRGYVVEGARWSRGEIELWIQRLERVLDECRARLGAGDSAFFESMRWYGASQWEAAYERLERYAERFDPLIRRGRAELEAGERAAEAVHGTQAERGARKRAMQAAVEEAHRTEPSRSYTSLCKAVAPSFGCSDRTVRRNTSDPT